ncbi:MAG: hypothetical protein ACI8ZM_005283 [Crocinitomix sp.]|jgi:hypothetical protein
MKKAILGVGIIIGLTSCGGFTEEQGKAAEAMCECMEGDPYGDYDINFYECDIQLKVTYGTETFEEGSWVEALEEKCPDVAAKME